MAIVKLLGARLSFPDLFEAKQFEGKGPFSYRASFLQEKDTPVMVQQADGSWKKSTMPKVLLAVATEKWKDKAEKTLMQMEDDPQKCCWYDGEVKSYDGYEGNYCLSATRGQEKGRPMVVDTDKSPLTEKDGKPYAGCNVNATVEIWPQDNKWGKGMRATLRGVQFAGDNDAFSAGTPTSEDEFDEIAAPETADDIS